MKKGVENYLSRVSVSVNKRFQLELEIICPTNWGNSFNGK